MNLKKTLAGLTLSVLSLSAYSQNLDEIVKKHIEAIGGKDNWVKIKNFKSENIIKANGADIKVTIYQVDKKAQRQTISAMGMEGYMILTNTEGWQFMPFQGQTKPEAMTADDVKKSQEQLSIQDEFITYKEMGRKMEYVGKDDVDGTECFKIKMTSKDSSEMTFFIDPSNYYVIKQVQKKMINGKEQENTTSYGDFRKLPEGIIYPFSISGGWGDIQVVSVEVNAKIDEALFKPSVPAAK